MRTCVLIGKPNVGKTLLLLNLAKFLGNKTIKFHSMDADGKAMAKVYDIEVAKRYLCSRQPFSTTGIQWVRINIGRQYIELVDTTGLTNSIPETIDLRTAMAQTIIFIKKASMLLHVVDVTALSPETLPVDDIDAVISNTFGHNDNYLMLVNKIDTMDQATGLLNKVTQTFNVSGDKIIHVSALNKTGFNGIMNHINE